VGLSALDVGFALILAKTPSLACPRFAALLDAEGATGVGIAAGTRGVDSLRKMEAFEFELLPAVPLDAFLISLSSSSSSLGESNESTSAVDGSSCVGEFDRDSKAGGGEFGGGGT